MFKKGSYNVKKASEKDNKPEEKRKRKRKKRKRKKIELKKKAEIKHFNKKESPEYYRKSHPKNVTTKNWVENETFKTK